MIGSACLAAKTRPILRITLVPVDNAASCLRHAPGSSSRGGWKFARLAAGGEWIRTLSSAPDSYGFEALSGWGRVPVERGGVIAFARPR
jgi:hypothetical protein